MNIGSIPLFLMCLAAHFSLLGQVQTLTQHSIDNEVQVISFVNESKINSHYRFADSTQISVKDHRLQVYSKSYPDSICQPDYTGKSNHCVVLECPIFTRVFRLDRDLYALTGYYASEGVFAKHLWILRTETVPTFTTKVALLSSRSGYGNEIHFSYNYQQKEVVINSRKNGIMDHEIFLLDETDYFIQNPFLTEPQLHYIYKIKTLPSESKDAIVQEIYYTVPIQ